MSQTTTPTAAAQNAPAAPKVSRRSRWRTEVESTPGKLRLAAGLAVLAALAFSLLGGAGYMLWSNNIAAARGDAAQLVRVQTIQNNLLAADAAVSNAYLAGGVAGAQNIADYRQALKEAVALLPRVAAANPADADTAAALAEATTRYADQMARAAETNEQQLLVGAAYLRSGGKILRSEIVPALDQMSALERRRVDDGYNAASRATALMVGGAALAIAGGVLAQLWLSRRTHRYVNLPAGLGTASIVLGTVVGLVVLSGAASRAADVGRHSYVATAALAEARTRAYDAKANEALGLIARGNYPNYESVSVGDLKAADDALARAEAAGADASSRQALGAWTTIHAKVTQADKENRWVDAKDIVVAVGTGSSNDTFNAFGTTSKAALEHQADQTSQRLGSAGQGLAWMGGLSVLVGLIAAAGAWAGFAQRWEEYR